MDTNIFEPEVRFSVVKRLKLYPMSYSEAVSEMERLGFNFWMFMEHSAKQVCVVYKRLDDTYGLLEAVKKI